MCNPASAEQDNCLNVGKRKSAWLALEGGDLGGTEEMELLKTKCAEKYRVTHRRCSIYI